MGMFDEIIATITCPCCKTTYLDEGIQTKHFACNLSKMYEGDDTRTLSKERGYTKNVFSNIQNMAFPCYTMCVACEVWLDMTGEIRNYIFTKIVPDMAKTLPQQNNGICLDLKSHAKYAVENNLLTK